MNAEAEIAAQVIDMVKAQAGAIEATVMVDTTSRALTRFANSMIHQNMTDVNTTVRLKLHLDGRTVSVESGVAGADALRETVARTLTAARLAPADPGWPGLAEPAALNGGAVLDPAIVDASPDDRAERVRAFVEAAGGLTTAGFCQTRTVRGAFANTAGQYVSGATSDIAMTGIARTDSSDGLARMSSSRMADIDGAVLGARAAAKARAGENPTDLAPGRYEVVLEPTAAEDMVQAFAFFGFSGRSVTEGLSFLEVGKDQLDAAITFVDDAVAPTAIGLPFDLDGTPKRRVELIRAGHSVTPAYDLRSAAVAGVATTGHGLGTAEGAFPINLSIAGTGGPAPTEVDGPIVDSAAAALVANVTRGLLVTDHWYTRVLDPRTLVMTGLTRNGVWLIENGEIVRPVRNLRFTQSYPQALGPGQVLGVGSHAVTMPDDYMPAAFAAPALHLASWNFTGNAAG